MKRITRLPPIGGQAKRRTTKIRPKPLEGSIFGCFWNFDKCRPEVADDVISSIPVEPVGMDVLVEFGDSTLNLGLIILLVAGWSCFMHLDAVFSCSLLQTGSSWPCHIWRVYVTDCP